jgi:copper homeostasis protein
MKSSDNFLIEIATADFETTKAAVEGGADRIELCAALTEGGTTPSWGMIRRCRESFDLPIFPIIRPRSGDFLYSFEEYDCMVHDIHWCRDLGCEGVVIGMLQKDGAIDKKRVAHLIEKAYPMEVTFHRAFDRCRDPFEAMELLIELGCNRILTSGQEPGAPGGAELITKLVAAADHRIVIMPGSSVRKENIRELAEKTGATEFHSSLRGRSRSAMQFIHPAFAASEESYSNPFIDQEEVRALRKALQS